MALELLKIDRLDVNIQNSDGYTALIWACFKGLTEVALELLKVDGLDVNIQNSDDGRIALMTACRHGHADIALCGAVTRPSSRQAHQTKGWKQRSDIGSRQGSDSRGDSHRGLGPRRRAHAVDEDASLYCMSV